MDITAQLLQDNGFEENYEIYRLYDWVEMNLNIEDKYFISVESVSNTVGRNWCVKVDNCDRDLMCKADIQTVKHFNAVMDLYDINFNLVYGKEEKEY